MDLRGRGKLFYLNAFSFCFSFCFSMADSNQITIAEILHAVASRAHLLVDFISSTNASQLHNKRILVKNSRVFQIKGYHYLAWSKEEKCPSWLHGK